MLACDRCLNLDMPSNPCDIRTVGICMEVTPSELRRYPIEECLSLCGCCREIIEGRMRAALALVYANRKEAADEDAQG
jgi:hypothetical protein